MKNRKFLWIVLLVVSLFLLSGCTEINEPITAESEGIWNSYFVYPLSWLIVKFAELIQSPAWNYGVSIILVTILIRIILLPLMIKQMKSTKAMQEIQPQIQALKEKYSSKDQKTQQKLNQETMLLFQKNNINPMAGCLPILIQMPILIAFYHAIMRTSEISQHTFLWFDLGARDPYFILPVLAALGTFVQQKIVMRGQPDNPQMKIMLYVMPIMILVFAVSLPSALSLYWVVGNIFSIVQSIFIHPSVKPEVVPTSSGGGKK
ncbi:MAG TPA: YidC family membrane integrase SpoIIIJ [Firmicutes bacterium]|nr:YidC family membrane integrase SpoIIIJ [Bacillales bacterium]HJA41461.1 YidC family membrane integrase SpoIIIJ [Bacillota bacterium]